MFRKIACFRNVYVIAVCVFVTTHWHYYTTFVLRLPFLPSVFDGSSSKKSYCSLEGCQLEWNGRGVFFFFVIREMKMGIMQSNTKLPAP